MRDLNLVALLLLTALPAPAILAQCAEPSALDVDPGVEPLRVEKSGRRDLRVSWETVLASGYRLHRGRLDRLVANRTYDHRVVAESTPAEATIEKGSRSWYFLVNSDCRASDSGVGRDSDGTERPHGGLISVHVGLQGGMGVFAVDYSLLFPDGEAFTDDDAVTFLGPYARGAPNSPIPVANTNLPGEVRTIALFLQFDPDPSFDPPPDTPLDIQEVLFGYHGTPPTAGRFSVTNCEVTNTDDQLVAETTCLISSHDVLF